MKTGQHWFEPKVTNAHEGWMVDGQETLFCCDGVP